MIGPFDTRVIFFDEFLLDTRFLVASKALVLCTRLVGVACFGLETVMLERGEEGCRDEREDDEVDCGRIDS